MRSIFLSVLVIGNIYANSVNNKYLDELSLEELMNLKIYSASKSYQSIEEIPANITVLTRKDIEKYNYTTLDELIKHIPGLFLIDDTEHFQIGSRGSLGSSFKLMINNNPISPLRIPKGGMSNRNFFATPILSIDRIEIIKGSQSVTYGNNSMYGSINIITNDFCTKNIVSISKGNNDQSLLFLRTNHKNDNGGFTLNTSFYNTKGISGDLKNSVSQENYNNKIKNKSHTRVDGFLTNEYKTFDISYHYKNLITDLTYSKTNYGIFVENSYRNGVQVEQVEKAISFTYEDDINDDLTYKINYIKSQKNYDINDFADFYPIHYGKSNHAINKRDQIDIHLNYTINEKLMILLGSSYENINFSFYGKNDTYAIKRNYELQTKDLYTKVQYKVNSKFEMNAGIRYTERGKFNIFSEIDKDLSTTSYDDSKNIDYDKNIFLLPELSLIYHIKSNKHIKLLYGKATQLTYSSSDEYEFMDSIELSYSQNSNNILFNTSLFYNEQKNINLFSQHKLGIKANTIKNKLYTKGIEVEITYKSPSSLTIASSLSLQKTENIENKKLTPGFSPEMIFKLNTSYKYKKTRYSLLFDYISSMKSAINEDDYKRYGKNSKALITLSTNIKYRYNKSHSLDFKINNLFNKDNKIPAASTFTSSENGFFNKKRNILVKYTYEF
ncbi:MAG: TonB-dependent receptor plug domain-containing protein [Campylobacterales bacterium]|nr:TonB-dependent receptor plug domain-containing protein [Campylobacterales bacterium]